MTKFVFTQMKENSFDDDKMKNIWRYAKFVNQELNIEMFIGRNPLFKDFKIKESNGVDLTKSIVYQDILHLFW